MSTEMYKERRLTEGYPDLAKLASDKFARSQGERPDYRPALERIMTYLNRLVDLDQSRNILVVGCGPKPQTLQILLDLGHHALVVEPVPSFVETAHQYLGAPDMVLRGTAEHIPVPDESQHLVLLESVMEHVDSPIHSLEETYRVLVPGGIALIITSNRLRFSLFGENAEFTTRFYNWFPDIVKECYVFHHLHYKPSLAHYAERPAVHWYCYSDLCKLGRRAGFCRFYSIVDLVRPEDPTIARSWLRKKPLRRIQLHPWLRALALTQVGDTIVMLKGGLD